jgi:ABC-2 type transport system ATP-binding protein
VTGATTRKETAMITPSDTRHGGRPAAARPGPAARSAIVVDGVTKSYGARDALDDVSLEVPAGSVLALLGPNGAGKTTLVRVLTTLIRPDRGRALVNGHDVTARPADVRRAIGLVGQHAAVDEYLTGRENLMLVARLLRHRKGAARERVGRALDRFELGDVADAPAGTYSGGLRRRLDLAVTLLADPAVVFLDEPTTGLDPASRQGLWALVDRLVAGGTTVLLTTQYLEEADRLAGTVAVIDHGRLIATGAPDDLKARLGGDVVRIRLADPADVGPARAALGEAVARGSVAAIDPPGGHGDLPGGHGDLPGGHGDLPGGHGDLPGGLGDRPGDMPGGPGDRPGEAVVELRGPDGAALLPAALRALDARGLAVTAAEVRRPRLDDVFLALTGQRTGPGHRHDDHDGQDDDDGCHGAAAPAAGPHTRRHARRSH